MILQARALAPILYSGARAIFQGRNGALAADCDLMIPSIGIKMEDCAAEH